MIHTLTIRRLRARPLDAALEEVDHLDPILLEPLAARDGFATALGRPGNGLEWDEERLRVLRDA